MELKKKEKEEEIMLIKNTDLKKMVKEKGRHYTLTMYVNRKFDMTKKQLEYVLNKKEVVNNAK